MQAPDLPSFLAAIGDIPAVTDPVLVRQRSRDMSGPFSPVLKREARDRSADVLLSPRDRTDVLRIAAAAARARVPLIARGGDTANFGQGIPLQGGALLDMTALDRVVWQRGPAVRAERGIRLADLDAAIRPSGFELRMHPSTRRAGTLGGYLGGGHAGVGSCQWGILRDRGNIPGLQVVSVEEEPRVIELRGADVNLVHHAYGANGLILEAEMPLAPAWEWTEAIVCFRDFMTCVRFGHALAVSDGIIKKLVCLHQWPLPRMMPPLAPVLREGEHMAMCMVAAPFLESFESLVRDFGGTITSTAAEGAATHGAPAYEFAWGHTRHQVHKLDRSLVNCIGLYREPGLVESVARSVRRFAEFGPFHFEAKRIDGTMSFQGSPVFRYESDEQMAAVTPTASARPDGPLDLDDGQVWPCFTHPHAHLDKGHILDRARNPDGTLLGAARRVAADRAANWSAEDVRRRFAFALRCAAPTRLARSRSARISTDRRRRRPFPGPCSRSFAPNGPGASSSRPSAWFQWTAARRPRARRSPRASRSMAGCSAGRRGCPERATRNSTPRSMRCSASPRGTGSTSTCMWTKAWTPLPRRWSPSRGGRCATASPGASPAAIAAACPCSRRSRSSASSPASRRQASPSSRCRM
jgi:hypothetical protein